MIFKGDVYYADLNPVIGSEQGGVRPVVILQNDIGNKYSPTTIVAPMTYDNQKQNLCPNACNPQGEFSRQTLHFAFRADTDNR